MRLSRVRLILAVAALATLGVAAVSTGAQSAHLDEMLGASTRPMQLRDGDFAGAGADFLRDQAGAAEFTVLGERHQTRETPEFTAWLLRALRPAGYEAFAVEVGPVSALTIAGLAQDDDPMGAFAEFNARNPFLVPFFDRQPEAAMLVDAVDAGYAIWGLDQEFVGSGRLHLSRLRDLAPDDETSALMQQWWQREMQGLANFQQTGSTEGAVFFTLTGDDVEALREAFADVPEAQTIISELAASARVYQLYGAGKNYESNHERIRLMRRHMADYLREAGGPEPTGGGKVLMKFGSVHAGRGRSPLNQLDVGNQAVQLATLRGGDSLNILVTSRTFQPADGAAVDVATQVPHLAPVLAAGPADDWSVVDLRPLRPWFHSAAAREGHADLADTVWAYDLVVVAPVFHSAAPFGQ